MPENQNPAPSSNRWIVGVVVIGLAAGFAWVNPSADTSLSGQATGEHLTNQHAYDRDALWEVCMAEGDKSVSDCILETACDNWEDGTLSLAASQSGTVTGTKRGDFKRLVAAMCADYQTFGGESPGQEGTEEAGEGARQQRGGGQLVHIQRYQ